MIYFDDKKQAYQDAIKEPLCIVSEEQWSEFSRLTLGVEYDVNTDGIVDLRESEGYKSQQQEKLKAEKIASIKYQLTELDLKSIRALRAGESDYLQEYESQAVELRKQLEKLERGEDVSETNE